MRLLRGSGTVFRLIERLLNPFCVNHAPRMFVKRLLLISTSVPLIEPGVSPGSLHFTWPGRSSKVGSASLSFAKKLSPPSVLSTVLLRRITCATVDHGAVQS